MRARVGKRTKAKKSVYLREVSPKLCKVARALRSFVEGIVPGVRETVNAWGIPTFEVRDPFCFYMVSKNHLTFGFHFGTSLNDPKSLLEGMGKNIRHVKLREVQDLKQKGLRELVLAAARLGGKAPMKGMRGK